VRFAFPHTPASFALIFASIRSINSRFTSTSFRSATLDLSPRILCNPAALRNGRGPARAPGCGGGKGSRGEMGALRSSGKWPLDRQTIPGVLEALLKNGAFAQLCPK